MKKIWPYQIPQDSFSKLEKVTVSSCGQLLNIFPSCMLKRLQSLQFLRAVDCSSLEAVFDVEGTNVNVNVDRSSLGNTFVFPKVTTLSLSHLHQLRSFYPEAHTSQWPLLERLMVYDCHKLNVFAFETPTFQQRHGEGNLDMPLFLLPHVSFLILRYHVSLNFTLNNLTHEKVDAEPKTDYWPLLHPQLPLESILDFHFSSLYMVQTNIAIYCKFYWFPKIT